MNKQFISWGIIVEFQYPVHFVNVRTASLVFDHPVNRTPYSKNVLDIKCVWFISSVLFRSNKYEGWNFNSGNYLFTTDTK